MKTIHSHPHVLVAAFMLSALATGIDVDTCEQATIRFLSQPSLGYVTPGGLAHVEYGGIEQGIIRVCAWQGNVPRRVVIDPGSERPYLA